MADRSITLNLGARVTGFVNGMRTATTAASDFTSRGLSAIERNSAAISTLSNTAGLLGGAMVAAAGAATKAAIDWESSWADVQKVNDGTHEQMVRLEDDLREMARTLPATHQEIAAVAEAAGRLGVSVDDVADFSRVMVDMGNTTDLSADRAATAFARFTEIMGAGTGDVDRLGSAVVDLGNNYAATETEIVEMGLRIAGAGNQIGLTQAEVMGVATALSAVGIEAQAGGSAISRVMIDIAGAVEAGGEDLDAFAQASSMSSEQFAQAWRDDAGGALVALVDGLSSAEDQGTTTLGMLEELGFSNLRTRDTMLRLAGSGDVLASALETGNAAFGENVALANEAEIRYETAAAKIQVAWNGIKDAAIEFGAAALPVVADLAGAVSAVSTAFGELPDWVQSASLAIVGGGGLVLLGVAGLGRLAIAVSGVATAVQALGFASAAAGLGRLTAAVGRFGAKAGIAAAGAGLVLGGVKAIVDHVRGVDRTATGLEGMVSALEGANESGGYYAATLGQMAEEGQIAAWRFGDLASAAEAVANQNLADKFFGWLGIDADGISDVTEELNTMGDALAAMPLADAQEAFRGLWIEAGATDQAAQDLLESMPAFKDALFAAGNEAGVTGDEMNILQWAIGNAGDAAEEGVTPQDELGRQLDVTTESAESQEQALLDLIDAQREAAGVALSERDALRQMEAAFDTATESIEENGATLDTSTEAGRANESALDAIAESGLGVVDSMREADRSTEEIADEMARARERFVETATGMGMAEGKADDLATELGLLPRDVYIDVEANMNAEAQISAFRERWDGVSIGTAWVDIRARDNLTAGQAASGARYTARARAHYGGHTGGPVLDPSHRKVSYRAVGGPVAGGDGTRDSVPAVGPNGEPYRLDDGEHILTKAEVAAAGGHGAVYGLRSMMLSGALADMLGHQVGGPAQYRSSYSAPSRAPSTAPRASMDGAHITGTFVIGGDGLGRIIDGQITAREELAKW